MVHTDGTNEILVTAATWYIGGQTIEAIKKMNPNATVVAGVYDKSKKIDHREMWNDADDEYQFDANNPQTLNFDRFNVVCIIPSTDSGRLFQFSNMLDECKRCSSHPFVVFCSVADTFGYDGDFAKSTRHMEAMLETSGLQYVIINCGFFHQNFEWSADDMKNKHKIRLPIGKGTFAPVDARDVARLIGTVMKDPDHYEGNRFGMVGNQLIGGEGAALIASQTLGYSIEFEDIPETVYFNDLQDQGCSPGMARSLCELCVTIRKHDLERTISGPLLVKLNNRTIKLKEYFENYAGLYETTTEQVQEEETERENVTDFEQPGEWGDLSKADEGYAEGKEEEAYPSPEFGEGWEPAQYGREEREDWKAREAERGRREGWKLRKVTRGREEEAESARSPPPVEEERVVAIERDVYYLKPETNKRVDVLRKAQRDYEELLALLSDTIDDWNGMLKEHRASFRAEEGLLEKLEDRRSEIHQALRDLDNEIREQERGKDRPLVTSSMPPITKGMHLVSRHDEKLEGGTRHVERYESRDRERDYERYSQRDETRYPEEHRFPKERRYSEGRRYPEERRRYPEERTYSEERRYPEERLYYTEEHRYPEERREYRSRSGTHLGRELDRGRYSTKLGRELQTYKGDNFIARISHILYGWKDKGDQEDRSRSRSRDVERGDRYYRGEMEYGEPRRESERLDRDYEKRGRRDLDRQYERRQREQDRDEEYRRVESERPDREYEERRRLDYERKPEPRRPSREKEEEFGPDDRDNELRREYERKKREYEMERPKSYEESQRESTKRGSFRGAHGEEERIEPKHRTARRRESGYASESEEYVLIPKRLIQEAISY